MILTKILIDLNICLDVALKRKPFVLESAKVMAAAEEEKVTGFVATHGFDTMFYILSKRYSTADT